MQSMVEGYVPQALRKPRVPLHHPSGGPPPPMGEELSELEHHARPAISIAAAKSRRPS
jgi:hypothetical protein